jgi:tetratricopeptide (TPR) repeat protein
VTGKRRGLYAAVLILALLFASIPPARAETTLREALRKVSDSPFDGAAHSDLARAYNKNGEPGKAASEAKAALALIPGFPPAMLELAHARRAEGMHEEAEALYEVYLGCHPRSVEGLAGVSESLARLGKWDESFASAMAAIKEAPLDSMGYHALGRAYRISGRFEEAVEVLGQALSFASEPSCILFEIGICHVELGDRPSALTQYEKLLETDRDRAALLFQAIYP